MTITEAASPQLSDAEHSRQLRRAMVASTVGTIIEAYDFLLYVLVAPLVFAKLYFPSSDPLVGVLQAFGIYAVGFVARPVGAALFGHYGDRIGRKVTLIATLLLTGLSTFAVGFVPGYASIGIWGAVILTVVRFIQGLGIGGEWGGATLMAMEWAKTNAHRGFITSWPQWGGPAGLFFANIAVLIFSAISGDQFLNWGWRVPFWISIVMVGVGLYIRLGIFETPVFARILEERRIARTPVVEVIKRQPKQIILTALCRMAEQGPFYVYAAFVFVYGTKVSGMSRDFLLTALLVATGLSAISIPLSGYISDRIGRKRMYLIGAVSVGVFGFIYFAMMNSMIPALIFLAIVLSFVPHDMMYGPQAALIAECFAPRLRYSGSSLGFHLASLVAGGPAPLIATALFAAYHSGYAVAVYILFCAVVSISATAFLPDYTNRDISHGEDTAPAGAAQTAATS
ncbi:MAG: MHS family MFS transporter [Alphaproteobacteria bacterium]|nr:MHS family MFS transporter [Alphaproteobacteria bacterium]